MKNYLLLILMGFSSAAPFVLSSALLKVRFADLGISLEGKWSLHWLTLPYFLKFIIAPFADSFQLTKQGRRKSWLFMTQGFLLPTLFLLALSQPEQSLSLTLVLALLAATLGATQDVILDAWRRDVISLPYIGMANAVFWSAHLFFISVVAGLWTGRLADQLGWSLVYAILAFGVVGGLIASKIISEPINEYKKGSSLTQCVFGSFKELFAHEKIFLLLGLLFLCKFVQTLGVHSNISFFVEHLKIPIQEYSHFYRSFAWWSMLWGLLIGGLSLMKWNLFRVLSLGLFFQALTTFSMVYMSHVGRSKTLLKNILMLQNFSAGFLSIGLLTFIFWLSGRRFSATQIAMLGALLLLAEDSAGLFSQIAISSSVLSHRQLFSGATLMAFILGLLNFTLFKRKYFSTCNKEQHG